MTENKKEKPSLAVVDITPAYMKDNSDYIMEQCKGNPYILVSIDNDSPDALVRLFVNGDLTYAEIVYYLEMIKLSVLKYK